MGSLQLALDLRELSAPPVQVWDGVPEEHQVAVVTALARLIARAAVPPPEDGEDGAQGEEVGDDE